MSDSAASKELVFVYGTLRHGGSNAFRMEGADFVSRGRVEGSLYVISWYPGLVTGRDLGWVSGDVFRVGADQMRALDEFEGLAAGEIEGSEYRRVQVPVFLEGIPHEETIWAWVYEWKGPVDESRRIASGDWLDVAEPGAASAFSWVTICIAAALMTLFVASAIGLDFTPAQTGRAGTWLLVAFIYGAPLVGIMAAALAKRRREGFRRPREIASGFCQVWLLISAFLGLVVAIS
ncbi:gamma-glutamylcyclotransferase family protein [Luteolibacter luteus]|uniref:Gamma-glutamylcyclotransferase n=1 Tax=Luteolibacter luteus TaxID=2728835 RepID=A0A858REX2_9BACT|nr:gamma-glutamylcyclotransferase family protein [Luteolibacter luteus]QJE95292.1 gamma-glutamylcyclotransferase [Luteolibacter luteus]